MVNLLRYHMLLIVGFLPSGGSWRSNLLVNRAATRLLTMTARLLTMAARHVTMATRQFYNTLTTPFTPYKRVRKASVHKD